MNSPWIHLYFREITMTSLSASRFHYELTIYFAISLWIHYLNPENTIVFAKLIWIHYLLRDFTRNSSFFRQFTTYFTIFLWIHNETTILSIWIYFLFRNFSLDFIFLRELTICFANSLNPISLLWNHYKSTILFR